jgi:hypothetical protein
MQKQVEATVRFRQLDGKKVWILTTVCPAEEGTRISMAAASKRMLGPPKVLIK